MREITYREAINEAIREEMRQDNSIIFMGEDIGLYGGVYGVSKGLIEEFGSERIRDTPISESAFTGCAIGAAMTGLRPIVEIMYSDFITLALDQLVNQAAKNRFQFGGQTSVPMVLRTPGGSGTGAAAQHSQSLEAWVAHIPGLKVVIPSTPYDAKGLLISAIRDNNPVVFIEQKLLYPTKGLVPDKNQPYSIDLGVADIKREGSDLSIITYGRMVNLCLNVANKLSKNENIEIEVVDIRSLSPLDRPTIINSAKKCKRVLVVYEASQSGGFGTEIVSSIVESDAFYTLKAPPRRLGALDVPIPYNRYLEEQVVPTADKIEAEIRFLLKH
jgi:pyruvate/2-oxoglutarate/acetoin dehydrogenase E1 component